MSTLHYHWSLNPSTNSIGYDLGHLEEDEALAEADGLPPLDWWPCLDETCCVAGLEVEF